jgi:hypothetical protein
MLERVHCVDCKRLSPENSGMHTLTTSFGWRLRKAFDAAGNPSPEWRCKVCWGKFKSAHRSTATEVPPPPSEPTSNELGAAASIPRPPRGGSS